MGFVKVVYFTNVKYAHCDWGQSYYLHYFYLNSRYSYQHIHTPWELG